MNWQFTNLLGAPYRGGNTVMLGPHLFSPIGNRVSQVDLEQGTSRTLPFENLKTIRCLDVSPDGRILISIDQDGRAAVFNVPMRVLLHRFTFKKPVQVVRFSPCGRYIAVGMDRLVQVWRAPGGQKEIMPMHLHRTYGQSSADITCLAWSPSSTFLAAGSKDLIVRVFSLDPIEGYRVPALGGHREKPVAVFFTDPAADTTGARLITVAKDGAVQRWAYDAEAGEAEPAAKRQKTLPGWGGGEEEGGSDEGAEKEEEEEEGEGSEDSGSEGAGEGKESGGEWFAGGRWRLVGKHFFHQSATKTKCAAFHSGTGLLCAGFSTGIFGLYELPTDPLGEFRELHLMSISRAGITTAAFGPTGEWLALGCAHLGQLMVWEWRSESYILKQQGHHSDAACVAYSPDGTYIASGADDCRVKVWNAATGSNFVTFKDHAQPVTAVAFLPSGSGVVSASTDGTVRAFDLVRYRNFRTMVADKPVQFVSLAVDPAGEVVCAGTLDTFQIFAWSLKTGKLLDVLEGHEGPAASLAFNPMRPVLASGSWDKTVKYWDIFESNRGSVESLQHTHDVLALAFRPDGKQIASSTLAGDIYFWDAAEAELQGIAEGRRDVAGGRSVADRRAAGNATSGQCFTSMVYSADGTVIIAGGTSKFVCMYDTQDRVMLARFQLTLNKGLDGVLDQLNSRHLTDAGPLELIDDGGDDSDDEGVATRGGGAARDAAAAMALPGTQDASRAPSRIRARCVSLSPSGRSWCAATTEGIMVYSLDTFTNFDPTDLEVDVTPAAVRAALTQGAWARALLVALRLNDPGLVELALVSTPARNVTGVVAAIPVQAALKVLSAAAELALSSAHLEFLLRWLRALLVQHGRELQTLPRAEVAPTLRAVQRAAGKWEGLLTPLVEGNLYSLEYLSTAPIEAPLKEGEEAAVENGGVEAS
ncbi:unnamed protein product [Pedinophyceae sp. YPF-701]|nr:unnamed protein product [Pedinophyceae sp. YPF-701]